MSKLWMERLEPRVQLSAPAYNIGDAYLPPQRYVVDLNDRLNLRAQLAGAEIGDKLALLNKNKANFSWQFDNTLLDYVKSREGPSYDFSPADVPSIVSFLKNTSDADQKKLYETEVLGTTAPPAGVSPVKPVADKASTVDSVRRKGISIPILQFLVAGSGYPNFTPVEKQKAAGLYIDWLSPRVFDGSDAGFVATYLQRLPHLDQAALAFRFLDSPTYGQTVADTLYTWAGQAPALSQSAALRLYRAPGTAGYSTTIPAGVSVLPSWGALDTGVRVYPLLRTFNLMLGTAAWTPELNTLFMSLMYQHGRVLGETAKAVYADETSLFGVNANPLGRTDNNKSLPLSGALLTLSRIFPEFNESAGWKANVKRLLQDAVPRNYRGKFNSYNGGATWKFDGFHKEQSPGYAQNMAETMVNQLKLSQINGGANDPFLKDDPELRALISGKFVLPDANGAADPAGAIPVATRVEALFQLANPDGTMPPVGDAPRASLLSTFTRAQQVLSSDLYARNREYAWPTAYPSLSDLFYLWKKDVTSVATSNTYGAKPILNRAMHETTSAPSENRPNSPAKYRSWLPGAGYYMLRSDKGTRDDVQLTFDTGLLGVPNNNQNSSTQAHIQLDLLNFELFGFGRPLIEDIGLLGAPAGVDRNFIETTVAHNSFTVDNYSHARMDGYFGVIGPGENSKGVSVTGFHYGYQKLDVDSKNPNGTGPALARTIWFDRDDTFLVVDWGHQTTNATHQYKVSFTLGDAAERVPGDPSQGVFTESEHGNVFMLPLKYRRNKKAQRVGFTADGPFVTAADFSGDAAPASRLYVTQTGSSANFVTLIHTYANEQNKGQVVQSAIAEVLEQTASTVTVRVTKNGRSKDIQFTNPFAVGAAPPLSKQSIPTRPITTAAYPAWYEASEGRAPPDLNAGRFTWGPSDATVAAASFSSTPITRAIEQIEPSRDSGELLTL